MDYLVIENQNFMCLTAVDGSGHLIVDEGSESFFKGKKRINSSEFTIKQIELIDTDGGGSTIPVAFKPQTELSNRTLILLLVFFITLSLAACAWGMIAAYKMDN